jgi:hypothetical protein
MAIDQVLNIAVLMCHRQAAFRGDCPSEGVPREMVLVMEMLKT